MAANLEKLAEYFRQNGQVDFGNSLSAQAERARELGAPEHFPDDPNFQESTKTEENLSILDDPDKVAHTIEQIGPGTGAYIGKLEPGIFNLLSQHNVREVYTSFPEGKIQLSEVTIGGKSKKEMEKEMEKKGIKVGSYAASMMKSGDFTTLNDTKTLTLVRLHVRDLGIDKSYPTTTDIYNRIDELGLDLCPAEVGPHQRLKDTSQPKGEVYFIGMKQIADSYGGPVVFGLGHFGGGLWLCSGWARPGARWSPGHEFVFGLRKSS